MTPKSTPRLLRVAAVQFAPIHAAPDANLLTCLEHLDAAARRGAKLVVFPECTLTGFLFDDAAEAASCADTVPGEATDAFVNACRRLNLYCVVGLLERQPDALRNAAVFMGPGGIVGCYRKTHLPLGGVDRFVTPGDEVCVYSTEIGRIGVEVCYDLRFPELTRSLALQGAELIAHPTNWPTGAERVAEFVTRARAYENHVVLVSANRTGREAWGSYFGASQIVDVRGDQVALAGADRDEVLIADVDLGETRRKNIVTRSGEYEVRLFEGRRPELYGVVSEATN